MTGKSLQFRSPKNAVRPAPMSFSPRTREEQRVQTAIAPIIETKFEVNSLSFEAALPGLANMLNTYNRFPVSIKPKFDKSQGVKKEIF